MPTKFTIVVFGLWASQVLPAAYQSNELCAQPAAKKTPPVEEESINGVPLSSYVASLSKKEFRDHRLQAMRTIAFFAKSPQQYIPTYVEALQDPDEVVRISAAQSLGQLGKRLPSLTGDFL